MKNIYSKICLLSFFLSFVMMCIGCSSDAQNKLETSSTLEDTTKVEPVSKRKEILTLKDSIEVRLAEAMERLRYRDNSGLYENEFSYFTDETTFDKYLTFREISNQTTGEVISLVVDSLDVFNEDSVGAWITVNLEFEDGRIEEMNEQLLTVYYHNNKWIRPTVSNSKLQYEYEELIRQAEEAANWENE